MTTKFDKLAYAVSLVESGVLSIDRQGRIWRHYVLAGKYRKRVKIVKRRAESPTNKGYLAVVLGVPGEKRTRKVYAHVLVWTVKRGPIPAGMQVNHDDLDKTNNRPGNLELMTQSKNMLHSYANGRTRPWTTARYWRPGILLKRLEGGGR